MLDRDDATPGLAKRAFGVGVALAGTPALRSGTRAALDWSLEQGVPMVQLDAAAPDCRPRDLDASARRDLAASIRRRSLSFAGVDLWIPAKHFADGAHVDRAVAAVLGAIELSADLSHRAGSGHGSGHGSGLRSGQTAVVSVSVGESPVRADLSAHAESHGVVLADHFWPVFERDGDGPVDLGVDPAAILMGGGDPAAAVLSAGARLGAVRLSDSAAEGRVSVGEGCLDGIAMLAALDVSGFSRTIVIDVRGVGNADEAVADARTLLAGPEA